MRRYVIVDPATPELFGARRTVDFEWARLPGGVFLAEGWNEGRSLTHLRRYDATQHAAEILTAATAVDPDDEQDLLRFVNAWGVLGCTGPFEWEGYWDSVSMTRETLRALATLARWLAAMQRGQWGSSAIPLLQGPPVWRGASRTPGPMMRRSKPSAWLAFMSTLNEKLGLVPVRASLRLRFHRTKRRLQIRSVSPELSPRTLRELLWLQLWREATAPDTLHRECGACRGLFPVAVTNRKRRYCSTRCKNRVQFRRWYKKPANRTALRERRRNRGRSA